MNFPWNDIDTVLLDMDGTLLDLHFDNYFWMQHMPTAWADKQGVDFEHAWEGLKPLFEARMGTLDFYCVHSWSRELELDIMQLKREAADKIGFLPTAENFLTQCRAQSSDVRLVTDSHRDLLNLKIERTGLDKYFHSMVCSHELDYPKQDDRFWPALQKSQFFDPQRTLFIDDNELVLEAAQRFGIRHLYSIAEPDSFRSRTTTSAFQMLERLA